MRRLLFCAFFLFLLSTPLNCFGQQTDIARYSVIGGYSYLSTPSLNLAQRGFNGDFAQNVRPWLSLGMDFSVFTGSSSILPSYLNSATQAKLGQGLASMGLPPSVIPNIVAGLAVPVSTSTFTYQAGPQINYRHFKHVTLFVRPALGLLHAKIQTNPNGLVATRLVGGLLGGKLSSADNALFYGFGGGVTWEISRTFGLRATADLARFDFFPDILNGTRSGIRLSVMPKFGFGKNILAKQ